MHTDHIMDNNSQHPPIIQILVWVLGFTYSIFSNFTAEKVSTGLDITIKLLTIISVCLVIRWHYLQIKKYKRQENEKGKEG